MAVTGAFAGVIAVAAGAPGEGNLVQTSMLDQRRLPVDPSRVRPASILGCAIYGVSLKHR